MSPLHEKTNHARHSSFCSNHAAYDTDSLSVQGRMMTESYASTHVLLGDQDSDILTLSFDSDNGIRMKVVTPDLSTDEPLLVPVSDVQMLKLLDMYMNAKAKSHETMIKNSQDLMSLQKAISEVSDKIEVEVSLDTLDKSSRYKLSCSKFDVELVSDSIAKLVAKWSGYVLAYTKLNNETD